MRKLTLSSLAFAVGLGIATTTGVPQADADGLREFAAHGAWRSFVTEVDGAYACGISTDIEDGGVLAIVATSSSLGFYAADPNWSLRPGEVYALAVDVSDEVYDGSALAVDETAVFRAGLNFNLLERLYDGDAAIVRFGDISWSLDLRGTPEAFHDMAICSQTVASR
jgi:hypothetical protein